MSYPDFTSDYMEGTHEKVLSRLIETNTKKTVGYGLDEYTESAKRKIKSACEAPNARVYFLVGGTQTNATVISSILAKYQGVVSADTGHIASHESGAVEATGHKVITVKHKDGKITNEALLSVFRAYELDQTREHTVMPGAVYISHPTEYGTLYTKKELTELSEIAHNYNAPLFLDGARLGYALNGVGTDLTLPDIARLCDVFYIGGTKCGALFGEAVVITSDKLCPHFFSSIKQHGALLAKGRMLGVQFDTLFEDDLYLKINKNGVDMAMYLKEQLKKKGYEFFIDSPTNQQFIIMENEKLNSIKDSFGYSVWEKPDENHTVIRLVTSFMTSKNEIDELLLLF